jgi:homoserine O-acetyltransferase
MAITATAGDPQVFDLRLPAIELESGVRIEPHVARGWCWGPRSDLPALAARARVIPPEIVRQRAYRVVRRSREELLDLPLPDRKSAPDLDDSVPTVLAIHALTGDMRAGGEGGWWEPMIGPGRPLDPGRVRILCFNNLGSCYGSSGPVDEGFPIQEGPRVLPTPVTPWDQARSILQALDALGIGSVALTTGGSLAGMIALCLAALEPDRFQRIAPIATCEAASAWIIGWNHVGREAVLLDPGYPDHADRGLEIARQIAMLTYRAEPGLDERQGRVMAEASGWEPTAAYRMNTYLEHQGQKLRSRFHPLAYIAQIGAMDHHDLGRRPGTRSAGGTWGIDRIRASTLSVDISTDQLFFPEQMRRLSARLRERGVHVESFTIESAHGHDSFLIEWDQVGTLLRRALALPAGPREDAVSVRHGSRAALQSGGAER